MTTDREEINKELDIIETSGYYGKVEITSQNGKLVYMRREKTKSLSGANKKK